MWAPPSCCTVPSPPPNASKPNTTAKSSSAPFPRLCQNQVHTGCREAIRPINLITTSADARGQGDHRKIWRHTMRHRTETPRIRTHPRLPRLHLHPRSTPAFRASSPVRSRHVRLPRALLVAVMLVFQGEGLELDLQRRRHPMWEWLFTHPAPPGAIFLAEMLSPIAANPIYWGAPLFAGIIYGFALQLCSRSSWPRPHRHTHHHRGSMPRQGVRDRRLLRFSPRSRGAMIGMMSWLGNASMMFFLVASSSCRMVAAIGNPFLSFLRAPWPCAFPGSVLSSAASPTVPCPSSQACSPAGSPPPSPSPAHLVQRLGRATGPQRRGNRSGRLPPLRQSGKAASERSPSTARNCSGSSATAAPSSRPFSSR